MAGSVDADELTFRRVFNLSSLPLVDETNEDDPVPPSASSSSSSTHSQPRSQTTSDDPQIASSWRCRSTIMGNIRAAAPSFRGLRSSTGRNSQPDPTVISEGQEAIDVDMKLAQLNFEAAHLNAREAEQIQYQKYMREKVDRIRADLDIVTAEKSDLESRVEKLSREQDEMLPKLSTLMKERDQIKQRTVKLRSELCRANNASLKTASELEARQSFEEEVTTMMEVLRQKAKQATMKKGHVKSMIEQVSQQRDDLKKKLDLSVAQRGWAKESKKHLEEERESLKINLMRLRGERELINQKLEELANVVPPQGSSTTERSEGSIKRTTGSHCGESVVTFDMVRPCGRERENERSNVNATVRVECNIDTTSQDTFGAGKGHLGRTIRFPKENENCKSKRLSSIKGYLEYEAETHHRADDDMSELSMSVATAARFSSFTHANTNFSGRFTGDDQVENAFHFDRKTFFSDNSHAQSCNGKEQSGALEEVVLDDNKEELLDSWPVRNERE